MPRRWTRPAVLLRSNSGSGTSGSAIRTWPKVSRSSHWQGRALPDANRDRHAPRPTAGHERKRELPLGAGDGMAWFRRQTAYLGHSGPVRENPVALADAGHLGDESGRVGGDQQGKAKPGLLLPFVIALGVPVFARSSSFQSWFVEAGPAPLQSLPG